MNKCVFYTNENCTSVPSSVVHPATGKFECRSKAMPWLVKDSNRPPRPIIRNHTTGSGLGEFGVLDIACEGVYSNLPSCQTLWKPSRKMCPYLGFRRQAIYNPDFAISRLNVLNPELAKLSVAQRNTASNFSKKQNFFTFP